MTRSIPLLLVVLLLAACSEQAAIEARSVEYFDANPAERAALLERCNADAELSLRDDNCWTAAESQRRAANAANRVPPADETGFSAGGAP